MHRRKRLEATVDPIVFTRVASEALSDPKYLKTFEGKFTLMQTEITVALVEDRLQLTVPGQPTYTLVPYKLNEFNLKGQPGFSVEFRLGPDGSPTAAVFHQPNGNFAAERVTE